MTLTVEIDPARRTAVFREVSFLAAGDSCRVVLDGVRGADFGSLALLLYRDAASESPAASCSSFSAVPNHPSLADGALALDTAEMAAWFADAVPGESGESDDSDDGALPRASASAEPRLAARASLAERSVRADGWLVVLDRDRTWAACRVPVLLRPGAAGSGAADPTSIRALVEGLVSAALSGKADKAVPLAAGNLASLGADGNLADSGATPASIKAAAVAEVVANAPGTMDTLKEIADILGSSQQSGTVLKRISDLETGKADSSSLAAVATSGSYNDLSDKPTIPTVDLSLSDSSTNPVQNRVVKGALDGKLGNSGGTLTGTLSFDFGGGRTARIYADAGGPVLELADSEGKTTGLGYGELAYDGKSFLMPSSSGTLALTSQIPDVSGKADKVSGATTGNLAALDAQGNPVDSGAKASDFAAKADLPYRLVEPGKWEFSDGLSHEITGPREIYGPDEESGGWIYQSSYNGVTYYSQNYETEALALATLEITFSHSGDSFTATRPSLPGHLCDRAGNRVVVTGDTVLTLPAAVPGYLRDFLVRLEISGSTVPTITFQGQGSEAPNGADEITYETDGDEFPVPDEAGTWLYAFTETAASTFAVALKAVQTVAAPTQGGS